jgi:hypothetical protein
LALIVSGQLLVLYLMVNDSYEDSPIQHSNTHNNFNRGYPKPNTPPSNQNKGQNEMPFILCHYEDDQVVRRKANPGDGTKYVAVSHVWGETDWLDVPGVVGKVRATKEKVNFITQQLQSIVGEEEFWMDILCVDQMDRAARIAITQYIPAIFRSAQKTIMIRDSNRLQNCCVAAFGDMHNFDVNEVTVLLNAHLKSDHKGTTHTEGVMSRLWLLQEIVISDMV